jgi:hypothetical protein
VACTVPRALKCTTGCGVGDRMSTVIRMRAGRSRNWVPFPAGAGVLFWAVFIPAFESTQPRIQWAPDCFHGYKVAGM